MRKIGNSAQVQDALNSGDFDGLQEVHFIQTEYNKTVIQSFYDSMEQLTASDAAQAKVMGGMKEYFAGPPTKAAADVIYAFQVRALINAIWGGVASSALFVPGDQCRLGTLYMSALRVVAW